MPDNFGLGGIDRAMPKEHLNEDHDRSLNAGHHTLGTHRFQASPGNHNHSLADVNSVPIFSDVDINISGLTPQEQLDKIWDIFGTYGMTITITPPPVLPAYDWTNTTAPELWFVDDYRVFMSWQKTETSALKHLDGVLVDVLGTPKALTSIKRYYTGQASDYPAPANTFGMRMTGVYNLASGNHVIMLDGTYRDDATFFGRMNELIMVSDDFNTILDTSAGYRAAGSQRPNFIINSRPYYCNLDIVPQAGFNTPKFLMWDFGSQLTNAFTGYVNPANVNPATATGYAYSFTFPEEVYSQYVDTHSAQPIRDAVTNYGYFHINVDDGVTEVPFGIGLVAGPTGAITAGSVRNLNTGTVNSPVDEEPSRLMRAKIGENGMFGSWIYDDNPWEQWVHPTTVNPDGSMTFGTSYQLTYLSSTTIGSVFYDNEVTVWETTWTLNSTPGYVNNVQLIHAGGAPVTVVEFLYSDYIGVRFASNNKDRFVFFLIVNNQTSSTGQPLIGSVVV